MDETLADFLHWKVCSGELPTMLFGKENRLLSKLNLKFAKLTGLDFAHSFASPNFQIMKSTDLTVGKSPDNQLLAA